MKTNWEDEGEEGGSNGEKMERWMRKNQRSSLPPLPFNFVLHPPVVLSFFLTKVFFVRME